MRQHPTTIRMQERLETLKAKPQHVRERIALGVSGGITLLVIIGWAGSLVNANTFALSNDTSGSPEVAEPLKKIAETKNSFGNLLGAVGAADTSTSSAPQIRIVDSPAPESTTPRPEQTVIHF